MSISSPPRKVSETENMLRLLYSVDALGSLTAAQLWTFTAELELMDYVSMRLCLHKLLAAGELEIGEGAMADQLLLTDQGREAISLFGERLPTAVREQISKAAPTYRQSVQHNRQTQAVYEMARPGDYRLKLSVCESDLPTISLRMSTQNRILASKTIHRFSTHAAKATTYLYTQAESAIKSDAAKVQTVLPEGSVTEHSASEFTAVVTLQGKKARFEVALLLPTRQAAEAFVRYLMQQEIATEVANRLIELISASIKRKAPAKRT